MAQSVKRLNLVFIFLPRSVDRLYEDCDPEAGEPCNATMGVPPVSATPCADRSHNTVSKAPSAFEVAQQNRVSCREPLPVRNARWHLGCRLAS